MAAKELRTGPATFASRLYTLLRNDLIYASFAPGEPLRIKDICRRYEVGLAPVREALNRLAVEGFFVQSDHRGFSVAAISPADLLDLTGVRIALSELALREAIAHGNDAWADNLALAFHRLDRIPRFAPEDGRATNPEWDRRHRIFHSALLAASPSTRLKGYCELLFDQTDRYRSLAAAVDRPTTIARTRVEHREIMDAALARDADAAAALLRDHYERTCQWLLSHWPLIERRPAGVTVLTPVSEEAASD